MRTLVFSGFLLVLFGLFMALSMVVGAEVMGPVEDSSGWLGRLLSAVPDWVQAWALLTAAASAVAALTPTTKDDRVAGFMQMVLVWLRKLVELLALDVLNAKPKGADDANKLHDIDPFKTRR